MNNKELYNFIEESSIILDDFFGLLPYGNDKVISTYNTKFGGADKRVFSITIHTDIKEMESEDLSHEVAKFVNNVKRFNKSIAHITTELTERLDGNERYHEDYYDSSELGTKILGENEYLKEEDFHKFLTDSYEHKKKLSEVFPKTYTLYNMITMQISIYVDRDDSMNESGNDYLKHTNLYHLNNMTTIEGWEKWNKRTNDFCRELGKELQKDKKKKRKIKRFKE